LVDIEVVLFLFAIQTIAMDKLTRGAYVVKNAKEISTAKVNRVDGISRGVMDGCSEWGSCSSRIFLFANSSFANWRISPRILPIGEFHHEFRQLAKLDIRNNCLFGEIHTTTSPI
jgi:hypothetical protein